MAEFWKLERADAPKKWQVRVPSPGGGHTVKFGARGYEDYTQHKDKARRKNYRSRHRNDRTGDPYAPGFWSWWVLWGETADRRKAFASAVARAKRILAKKNPDIKARPQDLEAAVEHASQWRNAVWTVKDFRVIPMGTMTVKGIERYASGEDFSAWLEVDPQDFKGLSREERLEELQGFRAFEGWTKQIPKWLREDIPPVVVIEAPVFEEGKLVKIVGDGRGRINMATVLGLKLPVVVMRWRGKRKNPLDMEPAALDTARFFLEQDFSEREAVESLMGVGIKTPDALLAVKSAAFELKTGKRPAERPAIGAPPAHAEPGAHPEATTRLRARKNPTVSLTEEQAYDIGESIGVDWRRVDLSEWRLGLEREACEALGDPGALDDDLDPEDFWEIVSESVLENLDERPDYYSALR